MMQKRSDKKGEWSDSSGKVIPFPGMILDDVERVAAGWLARLTSGSCSSADLAAFELWRAASLENDRIFGEIETMWNGLGDRLRHTGDAVPERWWARLGALPRWTQRVGQLAAVFLVALTCHGYWTGWRHDFHTGDGEIRRVAMADGSVVMMGAGTAFDAVVGATGPRRIDLASGEIFVEVAHDSARPFTVTVAGGEVRDIGTGFSVARSGRTATVAVEHGVVSVSARGEAEILRKGEQVSFSPYALGEKSAVDIGSISAWRRGLYVAEGKPLGDVLSAIDDYYDRPILILSRSLAARRVNAVVQFGHIDAWLDALGATRGVSVRRWGPLVVVSDRAT